MKSDARSGAKVKHAMVVALTALLLVGCSSFGQPSDRELEMEAGHKRFQEMLERQRAKAEYVEMEPEPKERSYEELIREGDSLRETGQPERAVWTYLRAERKNKDRSTAKERIGFLHLGRDPRRAAAIFGDVIAAHPESAPAHAGFALASMALGNKEAARTAALQAVQLDETLLAAWGVLGVLQDQDGNYGEAQDIYTRALEQRPGDPTFLNNLGLSYLRSGEPKRAEEAFRQGLLRAPDDVSLHSGLGIALSDQGKHEEAFEHFLKAGDEQTAHNNLGYLHYLKGNYDAALEEYELALLAGGDDTPRVLRNLELAQRALHDRRGPAGVQNN
jgi:Flp pilus assembly protein TadD